MELLVKPEILTSYIYIWTNFGNAESRLFLCAAQCFNTESMQKIFLCVTVMCKTLPATQIALIANGIQFGSLRVYEQVHLHQCQFVCDLQFSCAHTDPNSRPRAVVSRFS
jgi:hypothetical protein